MMDGDALDQTQYLQQRLYTDPSAPALPLDLHSASALGNYECVQDAISSKKDLNCRNKGNFVHAVMGSFEVAAHVLCNSCIIIIRFIYIILKRCMAFVEQT